MVDLVRSGRTPEALSREFEPTAQAIWNWVRQGDRDEGRRQDGPTSGHRPGDLELGATGRSR
jgi:transposase